MNQQALNAFTSRTVEINEKLERLQKMASDHFGYDAEKITWAHAGTAAHVDDLLAEILSHFDA